MAIYLASKSFSLAWGLAFMKSIASLISRVVGLFYTPEAFTEKKTTTKTTTVNSLYCGHCEDLELVSSFSESLFKSNVCNLFLPGI